jgi:formamidopyrimidine-DNA glycosylase
MLRGISGAKFRAGLEGKSFESTLRHGKYLFIMLSSELWLLLHFGLTGQLKYFKDKAKAPSHMRMLLRFKNGCHFACLAQRRLGQIRLLDEPRHFIVQQHLGPDALAPGIQLPRFKEMFRARRGSVKSALMDQHFLAGIGNIYSDEILFRARLHAGADGASPGRPSRASGGDRTPSGSSAHASIMDAPSQGWGW